MGRWAAIFFNRIGQLQLGYVLLMLTLVPAAASSLEYVVKATYLYKFVPFVAWPASSFSSPDSPINICIYGRDPFGQTLDQAVAGQRIQGRPIIVRRISDLAASSGCHVVYLANSIEQLDAHASELLRGQPILTVSDAASSSADRGIINFVIVDNKVRFEIDDSAAQQDHIAISSKLLTLAYQKAK
jgi:hypothetical protein